MSETTEPGSQEAAPAITVFAPEGEAQSNPPEQAVSEAPEASATADPDPGEAPSEDKTPAWAKKRFGELTAKQRAAETERDFWREQATRQQPQQPPAQQATPPAPAPLPPDLAQYVGAEPKPADFPAGEWDPEYNRAIARHEVKSAQVQAELNRRAAVQQQQHAEFSKRVSSVVDEARGLSDRVDAVLADKSFPLPQHVVMAVMESDAPAKVLAHLAENPEDASRIAGLRPLSAARELAKIEMRLAAPPPPPAPPKLSDAPTPPPVLSGRAAPVRTAYEAQSYEEYRRLRMGG